jgi:tetratricopeptide (TPR) repeat protein
MRQTVTTLTQLRRAHLLQPGTLRGWWRFHDLLRLYAAERLAEEDNREEVDAAIDRMLNCYLNATQAASRYFDPRVVPEKRSGRFNTRQEALCWLDIELPNLVAAVTFADYTSHPAHTRDLTLALAAYFALRKHWDSWINTHKLALGALRNLGDRYGEGQVLNNLGAAYRELRRYDEAIACHQQALSILRDIGDQHGEGQVLNNLGAAYRELRRYDEARNCWREALNLWKGLHDPSATEVSDEVRRSLSELACNK